MDDDRSVEEKVEQELREELGLAAEQIKSLERGQLLLQEAPDYHKTWLVVPVLARLKTTDFTLDWEAQRAKWYEPAEIKRLELLPGFEAVLNQFV